jgi:flagellar hook-associated protein 1 FlgK
MYKSTFMGLNTALRGVLAQQTALDVTGHNISNMETEGYTRQRADLVTTQPWSNASIMSQTTPGQMGTGVEVKFLERLRDQYVDANVRNQLGSQANQQTLVDQLQQIESALQEPGTNGISALVKDYFDKMAAVAQTPANSSARQAFADAAQQLTNAFHELDAGLTDVQNQSDVRLNDTVNDINGIASQIAALNTEIGKAVNRGQQPNDLLDTRDQLMDNLSKLTNFTYSTNTAGQVTINFGALVGNVVDPALATGFAPITRASLDGMYAAIPPQLTSGRALADEQLWDPAGAAGSAGTGIIDTIRGQLDTFVSTFVGSMNAANAAGFTLTGVAGGPIFDPLNLTAATISLDAVNNIVANPNLIAAASSWNGAGEPGNGANFTNILNTIRNAGQGALGGVSFEDYYSGVVTGIGTQAQAAQRNAENSDVLVDMAMSRRTQVSGVSMDEEMTNMLRFQHAYNASARVLTTMDEALDTIINRMGRVGL